MSHSSGDIKNGEENVPESEATSSACHCSGSAHHHGPPTDEASAFQMHQMMSEVSLLQQGMGEHADELDKIAALKRLEELKLKIEMFKMRHAPRSKDEAAGKKFAFWNTQPVPKLNDENELCNEPIEPPKEISQIRKEPLNLPAGFVWDSVNIDNEAELAELYTLLYENYVEDDDNMFRFDYSRHFLKWVLKPPGWHLNWFVGVRSQVKAKPVPENGAENAEASGSTMKPGKLLAFISAIPNKIRIHNKEVSSVEINFLCVHKKLRSKRLTPVLISEITRRVNLKGIFQAVYTAGVFIPRPVSTCRYFHRSLNPKKLIDVGFSALSKNMNMSRTIKFYRVPDKPSLAGLRQYVKKDIRQVYPLYTKYMSKFDLVPVYTQNELAHWLTPVEDVVDCYVVERLNEEKKKEIVAFFSFYILPSTVMNHAKQKSVKAAYSFYNVPSEHVSLVELMSDALVIAKNSGMDVFNALNQMENDLYLKELKFGAGDGNLHYYLFNWKCPDMEPGKIGIVLQ